MERGQLVMVLHRWREQERLALVPRWERRPQWANPASAWRQPRLHSRPERLRSSARASAIDGFAAGAGAEGLLCGRACETPPSSRRRYQQLRLLAWSM